MKFEVESPNGQVLELEGDHVPTDAELTEIFASVSPTQNTEESVSNETVGQSISGREWDDLDEQIQNFRSDYKDLSPELQNKLRERYPKMLEKRQAGIERVAEAKNTQDKLGSVASFLSGLTSAATIGGADLFYKSTGLSEAQKQAEQEHPVANITGTIIGSIGPRAGLRAAKKGLYAADTFKNIAGRNLLESAFLDTPRSLIRQYTGVEEKQGVGDNLANLAIGATIGTAIEGTLGLAGKFYKTISKKARTIKTLGGKENFKRASELASQADPSMQKSVFTREIFSNMNEADQKNFAKRFLAEENFRKEIAPLLDDEILNNNDIIKNEIKKSTINEAKALNTNLYNDVKKELQDIDLTEKGFRSQIDNTDVKNFRLQSINDAQDNINKLPSNIIEGQKNKLAQLGEEFSQSANSVDRISRSIDTNSFNSLNSDIAKRNFYIKNQDFIDNLALNKGIKNIDLSSKEGKKILNEAKMKMLLNGATDNSSLASDLSDFKKVLNDSVTMADAGKSGKSTIEINAEKLKKGINEILEDFSPMQRAANNVERELDNLVNIKNTFTDSFGSGGDIINSPESLTKLLHKQVLDPKTGLYKEVLDLNNVAAARSGLKALDQTYAIMGDNASRAKLRSVLKRTGLEDLLKLDNTDKIFTKSLTKETELNKVFLNLIKNMSSGAHDSNNLFNAAKAIVAGSTNAPLATFNNIAQIIKNSYASPSVRKLTADILKDYNPVKAARLLKSMDPLTQRELFKFIKMSDVKLIPQQMAINN